MQGKDSVSHNAKKGIFLSSLKRKSIKTTFSQCQKTLDMIKTTILLVFLLSFIKLHALADEPLDSLFFRQAEDSLVVLANQIPAPGGDQVRMQNHAAFSAYFEEVLSHTGAFDYPFDSLQTVSLLYAPDSTFRIITWYVPLSGQQFHYSGFLQLPGNEAAANELIKLQDNTGAIDSNSAGKLHAGKWYGAYYYELIHQEGMDHYMLLGWKGDNPQTRKRVIEPLYLGDPQPVFGKQVFSEPFEDMYRVVFTYSARVSMSLVYENEPIRNRWGAFPMIVFDRLTPTHHSLEGHKQFYKPEVNIFDGLFFDGNRWRFVGDVDVRMSD